MITKRGKTYQRVRRCSPCKGKRQRTADFKLFREDKARRDDDREGGGVPAKQTLMNGQKETAGVTTRTARTQNSGGEKARLRWKTGKEKQLGSGDRFWMKKAQKKRGETKKEKEEKRGRKFLEEERSLDLQGYPKKKNRVPKRTDPRNLT